ncbi:unnamed protein product [Adineta ricciae]|uniref:Fucosyltransferase n=1 Tax=Adineta ricciae TaxID=249248 RepID=A0A814KUU6_ADIRI|nr:unnamed protein product [Adineta ricciae]CAF1054713.1 unnamed protein product [Adineta ricciae]
MIRSSLTLTRKVILLTLAILIIIFILYQNSLIQRQIKFVPQYNLNHQSILKSKSTFKKVFIAHYTTSYGVRTDSTSKIFSENLLKICEVLNPEDYPLADSVFMNIVDFTRFPQSYRHLHPSQLWIFHSEESPRNSYRTAEVKNLTELDNWFNLTSTFSADSDFHIQYRGYRIKPEIGDLLQSKFKINLTQPIFPTSDTCTNSSSVYLNTITSILHSELITRQNLLLKLCPYTCNQPIPFHALQLLQPYLNQSTSRSSNRDIVYIAWFVSNCNTHSRREEYVAKLRSQKGIHIDIFGNCKSIYHSPIPHIQCQRGTPNCTQQTLSYYRFYLSFENSKCDSYITEKYWIQGTNGQAVPIVLGAKKEQYQRTAVPHSYIHVDDFASVEDLAIELHRLNQNDTEFSKYLQWTQLYDVSTQYYPTPVMDMHATLCFLGHYQHLHATDEKNEQINYAMATIRTIFNVTNVRLPNFNWETARTKLIRISQFYNPAVNCWDSSYPSIFQQIYNHLFTWWKFF